VTWATAESDTGDALCNIPAKVMTGKGREFHQSSVIQSETTARINFRWFAGLDTSWRILWDGRVYNIESAELDLTARKEWRLMCTDGVNDG
jgi:head-tail adaptor